MTVNAILRTLEYLVGKLEEKIATYEDEAIAFTKQIEALTIQKDESFAQAIRLRNITNKARGFLR
jgi:hypothetical protein